MLLPRVLLALLASAPAAAQDLTTTFAGGGSAHGLMFDLTALRPGVRLSFFRLNLDLPAGTQFNYAVWIRDGTYVGHESSEPGWSRIYTSSAQAAGPGNQTFVYTGSVTPLALNQTVGLFVELTSPAAVGPFLFTPIPPALPEYADGNLRLRGGAAKGPGGFAAATTPGAMINARITSDRCYANCDNTTTPPVLNVMDFICFQTVYAGASGSAPEIQLWSYANCDGSTVPPILNVNDFICYQTRFAQGCP